MSTDEIAAAKALQKIGQNFAQIARTLGIHINTIRSFLDEPYFEMCQRNAAKMRERKLRMAIRPRFQGDARDLTARFFGDPMPGRSALDLKRRAEALQ